MLDLSPYHEPPSDFARRWRVENIALFGSALRNDFRPDSDVDVLLLLRARRDVDLFDLV